MNFTLSLSQPSTQIVTVVVNTKDGTAVAGADYTPLTNQLVIFAPGTTTATVSVQLKSIGSTIEPLRTFSLVASNLSVGGSIAGGSDTLSFTANSGNITLAYNGVTGGSLAFTTGTTTAAAVQAYLQTIPGLTAGTVTVVGPVGGPFNIVFNATGSAALLSLVAGPAQLVGLAGATAGAVAPASNILNVGLASIVDKNAASTTFWSIGDVTAYDGNVAAGSTTPFTFTIFTNKSFATNQTINVSTSGASGDIVPLINVPVTLLAGTTSTTVSVLVATGLNMTANVPFTVTLSSPSAGALGQKPVGMGIIIANQSAINPFDPTALSVQPINWQSVVPVSITQGTPVAAQQNVPIFVASLPNGGPPPKPSVPYVATSTINISGIDPAQVLRDMTVTVDALFPDTSSLSVELIAPNNGPAFFLNAGDPGINFPNTVFDDQALLPITLRATTLTPTVSFRPDTPLSAAALPASELNGTWTLVITNNSTANFGTLVNWSLRLQTGFPASHYTPSTSFFGSLGNAMNQTQNGFTANLTRDPTDIFAVPSPAGGVPLSLRLPCWRRLMIRPPCR